MSWMSRLRWRRRRYEAQALLWAVRSRRLPGRLLDTVHDARTAMPARHTYPAAAALGASAAVVGTRRRRVRAGRAIVLGAAVGVVTAWCAFAVSALRRWAGPGRLWAALGAELARDDARAAAIVRGHLARALAADPLTVYGLAVAQTRCSHLQIDERFDRDAGRLLGVQLTYESPRRRGSERVVVRSSSPRDARKVSLLRDLQAASGPDGGLDASAAIKALGDLEWQPTAFTVDGVARQAEGCRVHVPEPYRVVRVELADACVTVVCPGEPPRGCALFRLDAPALAAVVDAGYGPWWARR